MSGGWASRLVAPANFGAGRIRRHAEGSRRPRRCGTAAPAVPRQAGDDPRDDPGDDHVVAWHGNARRGGAASVVEVAANKPPAIKPGVTDHAQTAAE